MKPRRFFLPSIFVISLASSFPAAAQTWNGGGSDDLWGTGANWGGSAPVPGTGTDLTFSGSTRLTPVNNYTAWDDFRSVFFASGADSFTVTGSAVDLFGKIENNSANLQTFGLEFSFNSGSSEINPVDGDLLINGANVFNNGNTISIWGNNGHTVTLDSVIQGTGGLTLQQNSTAILAQNNSYSGATTINAGVLQIGNGGSTGNFGSGSMTIGGSGTLAFNRSGSFNLGAITSSSGAKVRVDLGTVVGTAATSFGSLATGNIVEVNSGGAIDLNGITRGSNRLNLSIAGSGVGGTGAIINSSGTFLYADAGILNLTLTGDASIGGNAGRYDIGRTGSDFGTITGNGYTLTKVGSNDIVIRASSASNITYVVGSGRLTFEDHNATSGGNTITVNSGASLGSYGTRSFANALTLNAGSKLHNNGGGTGTWSGAIAAGNGVTIETGSGDIVTSGTVTAGGNIIKTGGSQWTITGTAGITGNLDVQAGVVQVGNVAASGSIGNPGSITLTRNDLALRYRLSGANATLSSGVTFAATGSQLRQHAANEADKLTLTGTVGSNTANGILGVAGGNLVLASGSNVQVRQFALGSENSGQTVYLTIESGSNITTRYIEVGNGSNRQGTINQTGGDVTIQSGDTGFRLGHWSGANRQYNLSGGVLDATALSANSGEARWISVGWDGQGLMTVGGGAGIATLKAAGIRFDRNRSGVGNSASTLTILNNGLVEIGGLGTEGQGTDDFMILDGGTARATATGTWAASLNAASASTVDVGATFTATQSGVLSGSGTINKTGAGILALSNTGNTFTGKYNVTAGTLSVGADTHFGTAPGAATADYVTLNGSTLRITGGMTMNANRGITIASGSTINSNSAGSGSNVTIASAIGGAGGLTIAANGDTSATGGGVGGSFQLSGANTFSGNVRITSGMVDANANFGDASNVIILDGGGLVDKNLNLTVSRNIRVGAGGGVLRAYGSVNNNIYSGSISNESGVTSATLRHTDGGVIKLAGDGSGFTGTFNNQRGNLQITANNANWSNTDFLQDTNGSTITFNGGGTASIRSLSSTRDVLVQNGMTLNVGAGGITMSTNGHWWQTSSGTTGRLTSSTGTLTVTNGSASGDLQTLDHRINLLIVNDGANPVTLVKNNVNSLALNQANTHSGGTTINGGRINADNLAAFGTGVVTINSGGQAFLTQSGTYANAFTIAGNGATESAGALGAIRFSSNTVGGNVTVAAGGARVVGYSGANGTIAGNLLGGGNLEINAAGVALANGTISLTGSGSGYNGTVTVSGGRFNMGSVLGGSVVVADGATLGDEGAIVGNLTLGSSTGSTLVINPASSSRISAANLTLNGVTNLVFSGPFGVPGAIAVASYSGSLTDGNGGTLSDSFSVPDAANYRTAIVTANAGVVELDLGRQNVVWTGATSSTWETQGSATNWNSTDNLFFLLDAVTFDDSATTKTVSISGTVNPNSTTFSNSSGNDYSVSGTGIGGIGTFTKTNTGTVTLTANNTFTGAVSIQGGSVRVGDGGTTGNLGGTGTINVSSGASLAFDRSDTVNPGRAVTGGGTIIQDGSGILRLGQAGNNVDITINNGTFQALDGGWSTSYFSTANRLITINDGGTLITSTHSLGGLGGTYNRPDLVINAGGTWQLNAEQYFSAGDLTMNGGTIHVAANDLRLDGGTVTIGASDDGSLISGNAVTLHASPTFAVANGGADADLTISANINQSSTRGITKTGAGTMVLSGASTYTGNTAVDAGRINVNGSITSATSVAAAAFLGGDGSITGTLNLTGTLLPGQGGSADRSLTINGNVTTNAGSVISFTIDAMNDHDQLVIGGGSSIGLGNADLDVTFDPLLTFDILGAGEGDDFLAALDSFAGTGSWFKLISGTTTGMFANVTDTLNASELAYFGLSGTQYKTNIDGQDFWVAQGSAYLVAIPEPRAALLGGIGVLLLLRRRR